MGLNETPQANRVHIAFFGRRNAGKSSLVNAVTGQNLAIVSEIKGTTTDPVYKSMELLPLGPVVIIDTPGFDDEGDLGELRVERAKQVLNKTDIAVMVLDGEANETSLSSTENELIALFKSRNIPFIIAQNKQEILRASFEPSVRNPCELFGIESIPVSAKTGFNINLLKEKIASLAADDDPKQRLVADLINPDDFVVLVIPIDKAAPKGRLILPQQQMIRDILEASASAIAVRETELEKTLFNLNKKPALVITDSQVFSQVSAIVPQEIPLTSFSILFARFKGFLETAVSGAAFIDNLEANDKILICEGCTHHRQCDDIGTVKIPRMILNYTSREMQYSFCSGGDFPQDLKCYKLIIHCGSCMLNEREMRYRRNLAMEQNIPFTNYGTAIAHMQGILKRSVEIFKLSTD
ncbi:MAG: [FeFe] hydrogenase H-cluster maturation GTPase HydF [Treponema sp.]|nr:[FeFe] hydrogenase H-cluster maturation GTPase HydF [Treponema sp.]MCL2237130.1 [FeFe] hydrogenase H-cluster maturation GTPase HydF [Treponema sp.]